MGNCNDLATKADVERLEALVESKIDKTQEASIVQQAVGISGQAIQAGLALQAGRIANALDTAQSAKQAALGVRTIAQNAATAAGAANSAALNASQAARKASFDALYAQSRASSAASAASRAASVGTRALSTALNAISIISTLATIAFVAALAKQVSDVIQRVNELEQEVKRIKVDAEYAVRNALVAVDKANEATTKALEAIANANNLALQVEGIIREVEQVKEKADNAISRANEAAAKANTAIELANATTVKADRAIAEANEATNKSNTAKTTADLALEKVNSLESKLNQSQVDNQQLKIQIGQLDSDNDALKALISSTVLRSEEKTSDYIVRTVKEATVTTASSITGLDGKLVGLESKISQTADNLTQTFDQKLANSINQATNSLKAELGASNNLNEPTKAAVENLVKQEITNSTLTKEQIETKIKTDLDLKVKDYEKLNNDQYSKLDQKLTDANNKIDNQNFPSVAEIALGVAGIDILKNIFTNTNNPPRLTCQAPTLVPPVSAKVSAVNTAVVGLQGVTIAQSTAIKTAVTQNFNLLSHSEHGLRAIQDFSSKAWKATKADKIMNALTTAVVIHNAIMLSNNLATTISEATNLALDALGIKDESDNLIDIGAAVREKIDAVLSNLIGEASYKALTTRLAAASRVYQASANVYNLVREIGDTTRSITEVACENTGKIGNALLESGAVYEDAYDKMIDSVNPQSKAQLKLEKFRNGTEILENAAEAISSISSDVIELQELRTEIGEGKAKLDTARQEFRTAMETEKTQKKAESQADTDVNKPDFGRDESEVN